MRQARALQVFLAFAITAFLVACGQSNSSLPVGSSGGPPKSTPPPEDRSIALACKTDNASYLVADYKEQGKKPPGEPERVLSYPVGYETTAIAYDTTGDLYVALNNGSESRVDEYFPGDRNVDRTIRDGIYHPDALVTDPHGNLYVANSDFGHRNVTWYKPGSTSPLSATDTGTGFLSALAWGDEDNKLWVADYSNNVLRAYRIDDEKNTSTKVWTICALGCDLRDSDIHGPSAFSEVRGNLYVLNVPLLGHDYVREYGIHKDRDPYYAREIDPKGDYHFVKAITTDPYENVYLAEWTANCEVCQNYYAIFAYDLGGGYLWGQEDGLTKPISIVASADHVYVAEDRHGGDIVVLARSRQLPHEGVLAKPKDCARPLKLAVYPPFY